MKKVLITGGTGLVGSHLSKLLLEKGYDVSVLSRTIHGKNNIQSYYWNIYKNEIDKEALNKADYIIHLAGANIGDKRWTIKRRNEILNSRIKSAELIFNNLDKKNKLKAFISASAVGYYGAITSDKIFQENDDPANDFLGHTCEIWEQVADKFQDSGIRTVKIRTGIVLSKTDGGLSKMLIPINFGLGSPLGTGKQFMPWIHIDDLCGIYIKAIEDSQMNGAYNAVAPEHINNKNFTIKIAKHLKKPLWLPNIPSFFLKLTFGKMSDIILKGSRISSEKIMANNYSFLFPNLNLALQNLLY